MRARIPWPTLLAAVLAGGTATIARGQCPEWNTDLGMPGPAGSVSSMVVFDDGSGPALYAMGAFASTDTDAVRRIARCDGSTWSPLAAGLDGGSGGSSTARSALAVFDDGSGAALYAGGDFTTADNQPERNIAKWNGSVWSPLGAGVDAQIRALAVFDDGTGPALFAGGAFQSAGGTAASSIAKWNGSSWSALGSGTDGTVLSLAAFDDGHGPALFVGGTFSNAGGSPADGIARWDGATWTSLPGGNGAAWALAAFDDGNGPALFAGGNGVSKWDGTSWSQVGSGSGCGCFVESLAIFDDGTGRALYAGGDVDPLLEKWDGFFWSEVSTDYWQPFQIESLAVFDDGKGPALFAGAQLQYAPYGLPLYLARWRSSAWTPVGRALGSTGGVSCLAAVPGSSGTELVAGGAFTTVGDTTANRIARFDGERWSPLGSGMEDAPFVTRVNALARFPGGGPGLYAGGAFQTAGGVSAGNIAAWDGTSWSALGSGIAGGQLAQVNALAVFDDGSGPALYAGGDFTTAGGSAASNVAKWDGQTWSPLGTGTDAPVLTMTVYDDGTGPALVVGGSFANAGGAAASHVAKWSGSAWSALGNGIGASVLSLAEFNDGAGPALYAAAPIGNPSGVFKWNGAAWSSVGNLPSPCGATALTAFDDGSGTALYAGTAPCSDPGFTSFYKWNGQTWGPLSPAELIGPASAFAYLQNGMEATPGLYIGLSVPAMVDGTLSSGVAEWRSCGQPGVAICFGDGTGAACPCGNFGSPGHGCENSASTGGAILGATGLASLALDSLHLTSSGERPTTLSIVLQGSQELSPLVYGDGLRCAGGQLRRLFVRQAQNGVVSVPGPGDPSISARSLALGDPLSAGSTRVYQTYYRDPNATFCPSPMGSTWNISNGRRIQWIP